MVVYVFKYNSNLYNFLVFMILTALLIWFLITETMVHVPLLKAHQAIFTLISNFQSFARKVRQSHPGEFKFG